MVTTKTSIISPEYYDKECENKKIRNEIRNMNNQLNDLRNDMRFQISKLKKHLGESVEASGAVNLGYKQRTKLFLVRIFWISGLIYTAYQDQ